MQKLLEYLRACKVGSKYTDPVNSFYKFVQGRLIHHLGPDYFLLFRLYLVPTKNFRSYVRNIEFNRITEEINSAALELSKNKIRFFHHCTSKNINTVPIIGTIGTDPVEGVPHISSPELLEQILPPAPARLFFKICDGAHGDGAFIAERSASDKWIKDKIIHDSMEFLELVRKHLPRNGSYIVQNVVKPNRELIPLMPNETLGTVRINTYLKDGTAFAILPILRIPSAENITDNFSGGSSGNIIAPVSINSGRIGTARISIRSDHPEIAEINEHPDTGATITGRMIPFWKETMDLVLAAQESTPELPTLGWDIAITDDGPFVIEANTGYCVEMLQVAYGRGLRNDLAPIFDLQRQM